MKTKTDDKIKIFLVDDDALFLKTLEIELASLGTFDIETFATGELCISNLSHNPDVIILDYNLDGIQNDAINGIETLDQIRKNYPKMPVIMLSSQDKIDVAIQCMHHEANDYVVKSETVFLRLQKIIYTLFYYTKMKRELDWYMEKM